MFVGVDEGNKGFLFVGRKACQGEHMDFLAARPGTGEALASKWHADALLSGGTWVAGKDRARRRVAVGSWSSVKENALLFIGSRIHGCARR